MDVTYKDGGREVGVYVDQEVPEGLIEGLWIIIY